MCPAASLLSETGVPAALAEEVLPGPHISWLVPGAFPQVVLAVLYMGLTCTSGTFF